jgi:hypothetical protein
MPPQPSARSSSREATFAKRHHGDPAFALLRSGSLFRVEGRAGFTDRAKHGTVAIDCRFVGGCRWHPSLLYPHHPSELVKGSQPGGDPVPTGASEGRHIQLVDFK